MPVAAKICGLTTPETLDAALAGGASHVGFVFFPASPRHLTTEAARDLAARVPVQTRRVAVMVDPDDALVDAVTPFVDAIQLHRVAPDRAAALRTRSKRETWAAIAIKTRNDLMQSGHYAGAVDRLLYDARTPPGTLPGGMGIRFDWGLLDGFAHPLPWVLSGGLDPTNVTSAIARTGATLVDVSSGVEEAPGIKAVDKIAAFLQAVARTRQTS